MRIAVIGAGQMGAGIAQVAAQAGHTVLLNDRAQEYIARGLGVIAKNLDRSVEKGRLTKEARDDVLARVVATEKIASFDVDLAVEAATEHLSTKLDLFRALD
ncbi:MAG: NAD(P)-binding domain-containing protein, partial [Candidatus Eremiobacteraeota bacterium]|nr:NAD(P)-binding domain-containing protein [Candidatus Eremiobacteraeota bacterium]